MGNLAAMGLKNRDEPSAVTNGSMNSDDIDDSIQILCDGDIPVYSINGQNTSTCNEKDQT